MELQFGKSICSCMRTCLNEVQNGEETLEIRLMEGYPDIGRVIAAWGQPVLRSKEWRSDRVSLSAGMMVWVLYASEEDGQAWCLEGWIPFQLHWALPDVGRDGNICVKLATRFVDARSTSARKVMVRCGLGALLQASVQEQREVYGPETDAKNMELLTRHYPMLLEKEAGEKSFVLNETLSLPASAPQPEKLLYYTLSPRIAEQKVLTNRGVFRGNANLHLLYKAEDGQLYNWDFPLPFSQFVDLDDSYGSEARLQVCPEVTLLELSLDDEGMLQLKAGLIGQYTVADQQMISAVVDAYVPGKEAKLQYQELSLPAILENRTEELATEKTMEAVSHVVVDAAVMPDHIQQYTEESGVSLTLPGMVQVLYYGENGKMEAASASWETELFLKADPHTRFLAKVDGSPLPQISGGSNGVTVQWENSVVVQSVASTPIPCVSAITVGEAKTPDADSPSFVIKRAGREGLWELAKASGSTMAAISQINGLQGDPVPGQMLLIPMCE